ncbi:MAG: asparagine--tRNA ligase [Firmicutes bacterium]|nr:asparagine--tRNA ligase [Alicyclobacillaceae bacterium]MCL6496845.1 asparagine--tRNA ligase [Bacillota bacterium]
MRVRIAELPQWVDQTVTVSGWVWHWRSSGRIAFAEVRDGTGVVQCVVRAAAGPRDAGELRLPLETAVTVQGRVRRDARAPGGVELEVASLEVVGASDSSYPLQPKSHGIDFLLDWRHLWVRSPRQAAILRLRAEVVRAIRGFLDGAGFVAVDPPILTPSAAEGTTTLFAVDYFGQPAYLSQSGQLYLEALAMALGRVYAFGPTFRAERSKTRRHLTEFWMVEPEMAFCRFEENLAWQERLITAVVEHVLSHCASELAQLGRDLTRLEQVRPPFPRLTYDEAIRLLEAQGFAIAWGEDLGAREEQALASLSDRPLFLTHFPTAQKAFYMQPDPERPEVVLAADLLAPEGYGEIIGGSERIADLPLLRRRMMETGLDPEAEAYRWYLDLRRWGSVPHSGFGLGLERTVAWLGGLEHVREASAFPRMLYRLRP